MIFESMQALGQTLIKGVLAYILIVLVLRLTGKRTLSKWNAFDFIVTVALGSALANVILARDVSLAQGAVALTLLCVLQLVVTRLSVWSDKFQCLVKSTPVMLLFEGTFQHEAMSRERVTEAEIRSALRGQGISSVEEVAAVVLETDGTFSVIRGWAGGDRSALADVRGIFESSAEQPTFDNVQPSRLPLAGRTKEKG
jgi:uncharacterized membrane protein YcaP (DUF421 family)